MVTRENAEGRFLSGGLMSARVEPGDSIVVPVLYRSAVTAGVLIVAF